MKVKSILSVFMAFILVLGVSVCVFADSSAIDDVAAQVEYSVKESSLDGAKTVYIEIPVQENIDVMNLSFICDLGNVLYESQNEYAQEDFSLMSYNHIVGELAMHVLMYKVSVMLGGENEDSPMNDYYQLSKSACLNIDESRISSVAIRLVGGLLGLYNTLTAAA